MHKYTNEFSRSKEYHIFHELREKLFELRQFKNFNFELGSPPCVIAGGYIRDMLFPDRLYKDIDIYIQATTPQELRDCIHALNSIFKLDAPPPNVDKDDWNFVLNNISPVELAYISPTIKDNKIIIDTLKYLRVNNSLLVADSKYANVAFWDKMPFMVLNILHEFIPFQFIFVPYNPATAIQYFDVNISKGYYDGISLNFTAEMRHDIQQKTLTVVQRTTSPEYIDRLHNYFPGFKIVYDC